MTDEEILALPVNPLNAVRKPMRLWRFVAQTGRTLLDSRVASTHDPQERFGLMSPAAYSRGIFESAVNLW